MFALLFSVFVGSEFVITCFGNWVWIINLKLWDFGSCFCGFYILGVLGFALLLTFFYLISFFFFFFFFFFLYKIKNWVSVGISLYLFFFSLA